MVACTRPEDLIKYGLVVDPGHLQGEGILLIMQIHLRDCMIAARPKVLDSQQLGMEPPKPVVLTSGTPAL